MIGFNGIYVETIAFFHCLVKSLWSLVQCTHTISHAVLEPLLTLHYIIVLHPGIDGNEPRAQLELTDNIDNKLEYCI